jgi:hypothetical protein
MIAYQLRAHLPLVLRLARVIDAGRGERSLGVIGAVSHARERAGCPGR